MRVLITGSREWTEREAVEGPLLAHYMFYGDNLVVVHGACPTGADKIADEFCDEMGITKDPHPADWNTHGKAAGPLRNKHMVSLGADVCLAFPLGNSKGTRGCMKLAEAAGIKVLDLGQ